MVDVQGRIGVGVMGYIQLQECGHNFVTVHEDFGLFASILAGINYGLEILGGYVSFLKLLFMRFGVSQIGGFGAIGGMFLLVWNW